MKAATNAVGRLALRSSAGASIPRDWGAQPLEHTVKKVKGKKTIRGYT
jgi:hypothetical protein